MKHGVKKYLSLFLLGIFLFAYSEKNVHDIVHAGDVHCHVLHEKHFHVAEHHCALCDFEFPWYDKSVASSRVSFLRNVSTVNFIFPENTLLVKEISVHSSRAPPVIA